MEEALLENVAAEKVNLSKIASGPCVRHRSFHRAFIEASRSIHLDISPLLCSAEFCKDYFLYVWDSENEIPIDANSFNFSKFVEYFLGESIRNESINNS